MSHILNLFSPGEQIFLVYLFSFIIGVLTGKFQSLWELSTMFYWNRGSLDGMGLKLGLRAQETWPKEVPFQLRFAGRGRLGICQVKRRVQGLV